MGVELRRVRVLVADDEQAVLESYQRILNGGPTKSSARPGAPLHGASSSLINEASALLDSSVNLELVCCRQAEEAVAAVRDSVAAADPFAVAFIDVRMPPGPEGVWAAERIRMCDPHVHIVMVTAYADYDPEDISHRIPPSGRLLYIQKPCCNV